MEYTCPHCGMAIYDAEALSCHFCGQLLPRASKGFLGRLRFAGHQVWWYLTGFFLLLAILLVFLR